MSSRIDYQASFLWVSLDVARHLREALDGPALVAARSVYVALAELHAEQVGDVTKPLIAERAGITARKVTAHLARLESLGLLDIVRQATTTGADAQTTYRLRSAPGDPLRSGKADSSSQDETSTLAPEPAFLLGGRSVLPGASCQDETSGPEAAFLQPGRNVHPGEQSQDGASDPTCARPDAVSFVVGSSANAEQPTTTQERASTSATSSIDRARELWPQLTSTERDVLKQIVELAKTRNAKGWDPETVIGYIRDEFRNRAHVQEATKFREYYSPGGRGENRKLGNLTLRWRNWLDMAPTADTLVAMEQRRGGRGRPVAPSAAEIRAQADDQLARSEIARAERRARDEARAEETG